MKKLVFIFLCFIFSFVNLHSQVTIDSIMPVRGFCIAAPTPAALDSFIIFIDKELAPRKVNTLILRVDYNYQYKTHPELRDSVGLSETDVKKIVNACRSHADASRRATDSRSAPSAAVTPPIRSVVRMPRAQKS